MVYNIAMDAAELQGLLDEVSHQALVYHGFVDYMRDYEVIVRPAGDPVTGVRPAHLRYLFRYCVEARCQTTLSADAWAQSLDDRLTDYRNGVEINGYLWGVKWHALHPGASVVAESKSAEKWAASLGIDFHEVQIETNAHDLTLVFSSLQVSEVPIGYTPFTVDEAPTRT
ncbi:YxiG-like protein [Actinomadura coerulea]|uniref:YxiG-like protein n=1 Tax=Actinomadura coerulea TaxID=46159 RepID=UPI00342BD103